MKPAMFSALWVLLLFIGACGDNSTPKMPQNTPAAHMPAEPEWVRTAVLYECNIRQFSAEGNFAGVQRQLPRLRELGVNTLWLMPIHPIGIQNRKEKASDLGSPYSVRDYYAINPDFGNLDDLKALVQNAHALDMKVVFDWVPNHTAWDAVWIKEHPEYYTKVNGQMTVPLNEHGGSTGWDDVCDLDYNNPDLRKAMIAAMQYWIRECDIDGYRVDMAGLVPNDFWAQARPALDSLKPLFMLSEWQDEPGHFNTAFNANYGWRWKDVTKEIAAGKKNALALDTLLAGLDDFYPKGYYQLYFTQNHDENSWNGTEKELYGRAADAFNVLAFTWQGIPMLYNGQEDDLDKRLAFFTKDPIPWKHYGKRDFFSRLSALRSVNRALQPGVHGGKLQKIASDKDDAIYAFYREKEGDKLVVILNCSAHTQQVTLRTEAIIQGAYLNLFDPNTVQVTPSMQLTLKPWEYLVLTNK